TRHVNAFVAVGIDDGVAIEAERLGTRPVARPQLNLGAIGGAGAGHVDAFSAVGIDETDGAVALVVHREGLRARPVAAEQLNLGAVAGSRIRDVHALAAVGIDQVNGAAAAAAAAATTGPADHAVVLLIGPLRLHHEASRGAVEGGADVA